MKPHPATINEDLKGIQPFSLSPAQCYGYFGIKKKQIYDLVQAGRLHRDYHYLKVGKSLVIVVAKFIEWMEEQSNGDQNKGQ